MQNTKEIVLPYEGKPTTFKIKRMGWGERNDFVEQFLEYRTRGEITEVIPKPLAMRTGAMLKCIVEAPFRVGDIKALNEVEDFDCLDALYDSIEELNGGFKKKKKNTNSGSDNSPEPTSTEPATPS